MADTVLDLQTQLDSLADMVLPNQRGLDLLTAGEGGICLFLKEECCLYANKSGIVKDKIKQLQENLQKRREDLAKNPSSGWWQSQLLPWLLPIITKLTVVFVLLSAAPCISKVLQQHLTELSRVTVNQMLVHQHSPLPSKPSPASHQP